MASNYDFRILIETVSGSNISYGTSSLVSVQPNTSVVVNTDEMVNKINTMESITVFNGKTHATASSLFNVSQSNRTFFDTGIDGSSTDYQFVSASIKGNSDSGSILFHANSTPTVGGDFVKRYKFFGNKVCNVLGVPENYWIYADKFRLTNTGSEQNYISGDVLAQSLHLRDNFAISNAGAIESDLPMKHAKDTDRWIKWQNVSSSIPQNDMLIGYSNQSDKYMIRMQNNEDLIISSSTITASNDIFLPNGNLIGNLTSTKLSNINQLEVDSIIGTNDDTDTGISFASNDAITFLAGGVTAFQITNPSSVLHTTAVLGSTANDVDVRIDAGVANSLFITSSNQNVGIGTNSPIYKLQVEGDISSSGDLFLPRYSSLRLGSTTTRGAVSIESGSNALLGTGSAGADASNPSNYHLQLRDVENATGNGIGIGFGISSNQASLGASIIHVREGSNSFGRLEFHTNGSDTGTGIVTPRVIIDNNGDMIVSQSLEVQENFTVAGTFNPSTISTNVFTASTNALIGDNNSLDTSPAGTPILQVRRGSGADNHINFFADASGCYMISDDTGTNQKNLVIAASPSGDNNTDTDIVFQAGKSSGNLIERMRIFGEGLVRILNGDLQFNVGSGETRGIDFDGRAAIRIDNDNQKLLIERTNGSGVPNDPIITIPTNTSDDVVATVEGNISASLPVLAPTPICFRCGADQTSGHSATFLGFGHDGDGDFRDDSSPDANAQDSRVVAPFDGYVHSVVLRAEQAAGTTCAMTIFKAAEGTNSDGVDGNQLGLAVIKNQNTADTAVRYEFGTTYTFVAGDILAIKWDSDAAANHVDGVLILMCTPINAV